MLQDAQKTVAYFTGLRRLAPCRKILVRRSETCAGPGACQAISRIKTPAWVGLREENRAIDFRAGTYISHAVAWGPACGRGQPLQWQRRPQVNANWQLIPGYGWGGLAVLKNLERLVGCRTATESMMGRVACRSTREVNNGDKRRRSPQSHKRENKAFQGSLRKCMEDQVH